MMSYRQPFSGDYGISQRFGETYTDPNGHTGIDYLCPAGTPILASEAGQVFFAGWKDGGYGYCVFLKHEDGNVTIYEHLLKNVQVYAGQRIAKGHVLGLSGSTGNSTGPHLHFEVRDRNGKAFDPMTLPLQSVDDSIAAEQEDVLKEADELSENVKIVAPAGAWGWSSKFDKRQTVFSYGTELHFTGKTTERLGYTYCECYPEPVKFWVAVNDGETQILDNVQETESESEK